MIYAYANRFMEREWPPAVAKRISQWLHETSPDFLGLQETKAEDIQLRKKCEILSGTLRIFLLLRT